MTVLAPGPDPRQATQFALEIALLGPPLISWQGRPLQLPRRQARALLYRLAAGPQPVPRDQLCFLLWPDSPEPAARRNLSVLLTQLRRALPAPDLLASLNDALALDHAQVFVDTLAVARRSADAQRAEQLDDFVAAWRLYRGPFLHGFSLPDAAEFDAWADQERQVWERSYLEGLDALVEGFAARGDYPAAIEAAQRALAVDELAEVRHARLIELYTASGDRSAALRQFERCVLVLERELGLSPLPETRAAYAMARDGEPSAERAAAGTSGLLTLRPRAPSAMARAQLPEPPNALIGREGELNAICAQLRRPERRLLTLCGPGGSGKTRLALEAARVLRGEFADGAVFASLAPLRDPNLVVDAIAQACGLQTQQAAPTLAQLRDHLREKQLLLVLDNFEHLLVAAPQLWELLAAGPRLKILVTSRIVLDLRGEQAFPVPPLPLPDPEPPAEHEELAQQPAVALLLARISAHTPSFQLDAGNAAPLAAICRRLDGLPLAIELAAARLKILSPQALLERLDQRLALLDHGPRDLPDRHRTLRATIEWSYRLLAHEPQRIFECLAVFAGSWTLAAAEAICGAGGSGETVLDALQALVEANLALLEHDSGAEPRFRMLETIREYALERLREREDEPSVRRRHASFYRDYVETSSSGRSFLTLPASLAAIDLEYDNVRVALRWSLEAGEAGLAAHIFVPLLGYWDSRGLIGEGAFWAAQILPFAAALPRELRVSVNANAGMLAYRRGQPEQVGALAAAALAAAATPEEIAAATNIAGLAAMELGEPVAAEHHFAQMLSLAQAHQLTEYVAGAQLNLGLLCLARGQLAEAEARFQQTFASYTQLGHQPSIGVALVALGFTALQQGDVHLAALRLHAALQKLKLVREKTMMLYGLLACCAVARVDQQPRLAATLYGAALGQAERAGVRIGGPVWALLEAQIDALRSQLSAEEFERACHEGRSNSLGEAIGMALALLAAINRRGELLELPRTSRARATLHAL
jgi:predicted ATPase/DNA-binding SARP family transcriptional activator